MGNNLVTQAGAAEGAAEGAPQACPPGHGPGPVASSVEDGGQPHLPDDGTGSLESQPVPSSTAAATVAAAATAAPAAAAAGGGGPAVSNGSSPPNAATKAPTGNAASSVSKEPRALNIGGSSGSSSAPKAVQPTATSVALHSLGHTIALEMQAQRQHEKEMASQCAQQ